MNWGFNRSSSSSRFKRLEQLELLERLERPPRPIDMIKVTVTIDFGPAERPRFEKMITVPEKSTVLEALLTLVPVVTSAKYGMDHFVEQIDEIRNDFANDRGWHFEVNGYRSNVAAERYLVKRGDWIKWLYVADSRCS